jgi:hypothetical protein
VPPNTVSPKSGMTQAHDPGNPAPLRASVPGASFGTTDQTPAELRRSLDPNNVIIIRPAARLQNLLLLCLSVQLSRCSVRMHLNYLTLYLGRKNWRPTQVNFGVWLLC